MNLLTPKTPQQIDPTATWVGLLTYIEMYTLIMTVNQATTEELAQSSFMSQMKILGIESPQINSETEIVDLTITHHLHPTAPKRVMSQAEYLAYWGLCEDIMRERYLICLVCERKQLHQEIRFYHGRVVCMEHECNGTVQEVFAVNVYKDQTK